VKPKPQGVNKPSKHYMMLVQDENNPVSLLQSRSLETLSATSRYTTAQRVGLRASLDGWISFVKYSYDYRVCKRLTPSVIKNKSYSMKRQSFGGTVVFRKD
jgi:hypothetical protein